MIVLDAEESHHAARVLRLQAGEQAGVFNGCGVQATGHVVEVHKQQVMIRASDARYAPPAKPEVWVAAAVAKGSRPDEMVDQLSQVGATGWLPLITQRSVVDPRASKVDKLRRVAIAAAKQSGRPHLLEILDPQPFAQALALAAPVRLIADASGSYLPDTARPPSMAAAEKVIVYVGPEGGWTDDERTQAMQAGVQAWRLGDAIMRVETAAVAAAVTANYLARMGQDGGAGLPASQPSR